MESQVSTLSIIASNSDVLFRIVTMLDNDTISALAGTCWWPAIVTFASSPALWLARVKHLILLRLGTEVTPKKDSKFAIPDYKHVYYILLNEITYSPYQVVVELPRRQIASVYIDTPIAGKEPSQLSPVEVCLDMQKPKRRPTLIVEVDSKTRLRQDEIIAQFKVRRGKLDPGRVLREALHTACKWCQGDELVTTIITDPRFRISKEDARVVVSLARDGHPDVVPRGGDPDILAVLLSDPRFSES